MGAGGRRPWGGGVGWLGGGEVGRGGRGRGGRSPPARKREGRGELAPEGRGRRRGPSGGDPSCRTRSLGSPPGSRGGFCGAPCRAVPRAVVGGGGADPERRRSRRLAPGGDRGGPAVAPSSPGPRPCGRGPEPRPSPRSPPAIPAPFALSGRLAPRPSRARGCAPGMRAPAAARGTPRRRPPLRASPRVAAAPHCVPRARVVAVFGGVLVLRGGSLWLEACRAVRRARSGAAVGARGARGTCVGGGRVRRVGGKGPAVGGDRRARTPPHARARFPPLAPPPRAARRGSPSGVVARRRVPRLGPCPAPRSSPPPPPSNPGRAPACAAGPCSRLPARRSAVSVPRARTLPSPSPLPSRLSPLPRSRSLSPSLPPSRRVWREGGLLVRWGGGSSVGGRAARASLGCFASLGVGRRTGRVRTAASSRGPAFRSSRRPSALASRGSSWRARARARPSETRPQIRRGDPLNLSILVSGGKETNEDSLSNGE